MIGGCARRLTGCGLIALILVLLAALSLAILFGGQLNSHVRVNDFPRMESYRQIDARTIGVTIDVSPYGWTRVTGVVETATDVRISVESLVMQLGPGAAYAEVKEVPVTLEQDLGDRVIRDDVGDPIPKH
jgi:hypothetical protein